MTRAYCETCDWSHEIDDREDRAVLDRAMIEHHAETGHSVAAEDATARPADEPERTQRENGTDERRERATERKRNR
ncbi:hypothetical protein [Halopiger thermotolerans]